MIRTQLVIFALLLPLLLGGRTMHLSSAYERHHTFTMHDSSPLLSETFAPCTGPSAVTATAGRARCIAPNGRTEILRQITIAVIEAVTDADEDCTFTIETSTDLSTWTAVASSAISVGSNLTNAAGVCQAGSLVLDTVGESCTRTLADGVVVVPGGGWRIALSTTATCEAMEGVGGYVISTIQ